MDPHTLPLVNACLNGISALLLLVGLFLIRSGRRHAHRVCMLTAFGVSAVFLVLYLYHKIVVVRGVNTPFPGPAALRPAYLAMLATHIVLAMAVVPMALMGIRHGLAGRDAQHRRIARWLWPIWMYVSVTGVLIYLALYVVWARG